jgi:hypothetical protein
MKKTELHADWTVSKDFSLISINDLKGFAADIPGHLPHDI